MTPLLILGGLFLLMGMGGKKKTTTAGSGDDNTEHFLDCIDRMVMFWNPVSENYFLTPEAANDLRAIVQNEIDAGVLNANDLLATSMLYLAPNCHWGAFRTYRDKYSGQLPIDDETAEKADQVLSSVGAIVEEVLTENTAQAGVAFAGGMRRVDAIKHRRRRHRRAIAGGCGRRGHCGVRPR